MTDHPGPDGPAPEDARPDGPQPGEPRPDEPRPDATPSGTTGPDPTPAPRRGAFDAALEGASWESAGRRRRSAAARSSDTGSSDTDSPDTDSPRRTSDRRRRSRRPARGAPRTVTPVRRSSANRRARHVRSVVLHVVLGLLGLGLAWVVVTGLLAAYQLREARSDLSQLRTQLTSGGAGLTTAAQSLTTHAHHAEVLTRGPAWSLAAAVPYVGDPFDAVRGITRETSALVDGAAPGLVGVADQINPRTVVSGGAVDLAAVGKAGPAVRAAAAVATRAQGRVGALPTSTWLSPVDSATAQFRDQLGDLAGTLRSTDQALQVLPTMLGQDGRTRRYFVAFQNNAELRGTGGLPGAFAIVAATAGKVSVERFESDSVLGGVVPSGLDFGKAFDQHYAADLAYSQYANSNQSPNFPYAAQIWCAMWKQVTGEQLDGALTIDPGALSYLLKATGPATAPDGVKVTADNVVTLLQKDAYAKFPANDDSADRKQYILDIAEAAEKKILTGTGNGRALLQGFAQGVGERRIVAWSADPAAEAVLASTTIGGTVADTDQPYSMLFVNNGGGGKLDYYLQRAVHVERSGCGVTREVTVTITLTNTAPTSGLPPYVTVRTDDPDFATVPGQLRSVADYVATEGALLVGATVDGVPTGAAVFDELGHPTFETILEITPGQTRTWVLKLQELAGSQPVTVVPQPGVVPTRVTVDNRSCG